MSTALLKDQPHYVSRSNKKWESMTDVFLIPAGEPSWIYRFAGMMRANSRVMSTGLFESKYFEGMNLDDWESFSAHVEKNVHFVGTTSVQFKTKAGDLGKKSSIQNVSTLGHFAYLLRADNSQEAFVNLVAARPHEMLQQLASAHYPGMFNEEAVRSILLAISKRTAKGLNSPSKDDPAAAHLFYHALTIKCGDPEEG